MKNFKKKMTSVCLAFFAAFAYGCDGEASASPWQESGNESSVFDSVGGSVEETPEIVDKTPYECKTARKYTLPTMAAVEEVYGTDIFALDGAPALVSNTHRLSLAGGQVRVDDISHCQKEDLGNEESLLAYSTYPAEIRVTVGKHLTEIEQVQGKYSQFFSADGRVIAVATLTSSNGSVLKVYDEYGIVEGGFSILRTVKVEKVEERAGYSAVFDMHLADCNEGEYFAPSRVFKNSSALTTEEEYLVSASRLPTPVAMASDKQTGKMLTINYPDPNIRTTNTDPLTMVDVSSEYLYGSLGFSKSGVLCAYPCLEKGQSSNARKYAALNVDNDVQYEFHFRVGEEKDFGDRMSKALSFAVKDMKKIDYQADLDLIYSTAITDMSDLMVYRDEAYVLPFASHVQDGSVIAYVAQSGYIGMQISCGYELLRYGIQTGNEEIYTNGYNMVNMWATTAIPEGSDSGIFYCYNNGKGYGSTAPTLRQLSDGAEGMLDALRLMESNRPTVNVDAWWNLVYGYAEFLVRAQNADGSWYRAYDYDGNLLTENNDWDIDIDENTLADKKYSTQIPIRFLTRMYEYTEDERYLNAARAAGEYVKTYIIDTLEYRGGTLDQKGVIEREAGIYAFYAMSALYSSTGENSWLTYAERAAAYALSFVYTHDFVVNNRSNNIAGEPLQSGCTAGMSPIIVSESGASGVDVFAGYLYYECFKMYLWTGNEYYLKEALVLQNCQKRTMDIYGEFGFYKKSFMCEATGIMTFTFSTAEGGVWLPWITNANIEPMTNMLQAFGDYDIEKLLEAYTEAELLERLGEYGSGGYEYGKI